MKIDKWQLVLQDTLSGQITTVFDDAMLTDHRWSPMIIGITLTKDHIPNHIITETLTSLMTNQYVTDSHHNTYCLGTPCDTDQMIRLQTCFHVKGTTDRHTR